ncbi:DNA repair protein RecN [Brachybacterium sp. EF45031]|uniref:DNA repair protein RecN n=1 Tax=Brachybacterium sillae TaxID=2810536 RepID=UPI00217EAC0A|nr:DNA repair protein RecN [Brachybacterium sillae]MCS6712678.1 DNA repair protein RecN [Brachybacterium sillae]
MLSSLRIRHIGVIDDALLEFGPGFTALTGETGAGKTMIVTGLGLLLGGRLDRGRTTTASAVDGTLELTGHTALQDALDELGAEADDGEVIISRRVTKDGRSRAQIGGVPVPIGTLARLVGSAVTLHGQADQLRLRDADAQREALDDFDAGTVRPLREAHAELWRRRRDLEERRRRALALHQERDRTEAALSAALTRLEEIDPQPGEEQQVRADLERLGHAVELRAGSERASLALIGEDAPSVGSLLDIAQESLRGPAAVDDALAPALERIESLRLEVSDLAADLSRYAQDVDASPARLDAANERLHELTALVRDLGPVLGGADDLEGLLEASRTAAADLERFAGAEAELADAEQEIRRIDEELEVAAGHLTAARHAAAEVLAGAVQDELAHLEMPAASVRVDVLEAPAREHGRDEVRILLAPHPGADHLPVATAASGGELSRVMLALEVALGERRTDHGAAAPVFVFDEIDAGIGGRAALAVGQRLARLAQHAQVIVVTHLPQVAAHATTHLQIVKTAEDGVTRSTVRALDADQRVPELARMLAGDASSERALAHAEELLADAQQRGADE